MIQYIVLFQTENTIYCGVKRDSWPTMMTQRYLDRRKEEVDFE